MNRTSRRNVLIGAIATTGAILSGKLIPERKVDSQPSSTLEMPKTILGKTGIEVPIFGLGGAGKTPLSNVGKEKESVEIIETAFEWGIRYFDTASSYGPSESYLGKVLPRYRQEIFLASKTAARDRDGAWHDLEQSLKRLDTNYLDLWQFHHVSLLEELERIFGKNGAILALQEAQEQKIVKFSGITGHHEPDAIVAGLNRYPFDTTLIAINAADIHHPRPFSTGVLPVAKKLNVGVIGMKIPAYGRIFQPGVLKGMGQAMGYVLSLDRVHCCIIATESVEQLKSNIEVARAFQSLSPQQLREIEQLTANAWEDNTFFRQWT
ncbi:MAG: hypothetical protein N5P05_000017 [Chroococcopsis gigantea SAG 12.99]|jgi:aryl-alcohol dehydrogenase-like predicted oxidoreductase|nr:hypothetical protein [Chroococcopsis gigantea SAG 12.99]